MRFGFDTPEMAGAVKREMRLRHMNRIMAAAQALVEGGGEEDAARVLVLEEGLDEGAAWRFVSRFEPHVRAMSEAIEQAETPEQIADLFAGHLRRHRLGETGP